jgi:tetratricopeptide (TPR) repeat protein
MQGLILSFCLKLSLSSSQIFQAVYSAPLLPTASSTSATPASSISVPKKAVQNDQDFRKKLSLVLKRTEKSIKLLTAQITESLSAPFLPDLYLQLAELQSQKSNTLYFIQMEIQNGTESKSDKEFSPVILAQKEAIATYDMLLKDFPKFPKRSSVLYRMALALKSIDEIPGFVRTTQQILREYPGGEEATRSKILLGEYYFEKQDFDEALKLLLPVVKSDFIYERNLARYKLGLIELEKDHFTAALTYFEQVIQDNELKEQDNPYEVSLKQRSGKSDLKREALIDSVRAYTHVFEKNPDPTNYYSKLAPSEILYQEVIEKLTIRYIGQKRYDVAIRLLRTLGERTADPEKTINIYRDVLKLIPMVDRVKIPVGEFQYVLEKFNLWSSFFRPSPNLLNESSNFFETQTRELGTTSHSYAKQSTALSTKRPYLERARDFYLLYLSFFAKSPNAVKIATNLGDVYYSLGNFFKCGEYYLRTFNGEFGASPQKKALIENSILCLQKKEEYPYYDNLRVHGLLIKSIRDYGAFDSSKQFDPVLNFLLLKTEYEQGFFPETITNLYGFAKKYPRSPQAIDASELILDYFNTRNDYAALQDWTGRIIALHLPNAQFKNKLKKTREIASKKAVKEAISASAGFDEFSQGKSYMSLALSSQNSQLANLALKEALAKSKRERDIEVFLKAASVVAQKERDIPKKVGILRSIADEELRITRYYTALASLKAIYDSSYPNQSRQEAFDTAVSVALELRDETTLLQLSHNSLWRSKGQAVREQFNSEMSHLLESPVRMNAGVAELLLRDNPGPKGILSLHKASYKLSAGLNRQVNDRMRTLCANNDRSQTLCLWSILEQVDASQFKAFTQGLSRAPLDLTGVKTQADVFAALSAQLKSLENSGDSQLDLSVAIRSVEMYRAFARFLTNTGNKNPALRNVLLQKAQETAGGAEAYIARCKAIAVQTPGPSKAGRYCDSQNISFKTILEVKPFAVFSARNEDPNSTTVVGLQKEVFGSADGSLPLLKLAKEYLDQNKLSHAAATASFGSSLYASSSPDFRAILGCTTLQLGLYAEAAYHLKDASDFDGLQTKCTRSLAEIKARQ